MGRSLADQLKATGLVKGIKNPYARKKKKRHECKYGQIEITDKVCTGCPDREHCPFD